MTNGDDIDWAKLLGPYQGQSISSSKDAQMVLCEALGPDALDIGVDYYLDNWMKDTGVLRYVFKILQPATATKRLISVLQNDLEDSHRRQAAADLLAVTMSDTDLSLLEALLDGDSTCQSGVIQVLNELRWRIDCDTTACARIVDRCVKEGTAETLIAAHRIAPIAYEEMTKPDGADTNRSGLLSVEDIISLYTASLNHPAQSVLESALSSLPLGLIATFRERLEGIYVDGGELSQLALEMLNHRTR